MIALASEAWHIFGFGIGQVQIIAIGVTTATTIILSYRFSTRGKKYERQ